ncbi:MAG: hypothetical protein AVDCRST_MAG05-4996 [uncultured Rubrobacteraceae bacterium]|uniref:Uncharacterized protein n=1 Tax=uncultured Rubrobacteraceae bacterium TaxID=349277 RepID=A0A6J4U0J8_9ACTN|nr:MAG: hypothetical protein AVDCRST_MAG05-4996 [uncultured Rubrobacteraceae bacterium]
MGRAPADPRVEVLLADHPYVQHHIEPPRPGGPLLLGCRAPLL